MKREDIRFYCGLNERSWNHHPVEPGPYACIAPVSGVETKKTNSVTVPKGTLVLQDSSAFCDASIKLRGDAYKKQGRLTFHDALKRQEKHAEDYGYADQIEARASYDVLIDETWSIDPLTGKLDRKKQRWSENDAEAAVDETVAAARYLNAHRNGIACIQSAQGVSTAQYVRCAERILPYLRPDEGDIFGLGGWCILGKMPSLVPVFRQTMQQLIPFLAKEGVPRVHIWGSIYAPTLGELLWLCNRYGIRLSADTAHPCYAPAWGNWGYSSWRARRGEYSRPPVLESCKHPDGPSCIPGTFCRGLERIRHTHMTRTWLAMFSDRESRYYRFIPIIQPAVRQQLFSFAEECVS